MLKVMKNLLSLLKQNKLFDHELLGFYTTLYRYSIPYAQIFLYFGFFIILLLVLGRDENEKKKNEV